MLGFGTVALAANLSCLALLWRFRGENVNMASTFEYPRNDVVSNLGVLIAAGLVGATGQPWPDVAVGAIIAGISSVRPGACCRRPGQRGAMPILAGHEHPA